MANMWGGVDTVHLSLSRMMVWTFLFICVAAATAHQEFTNQWVAEIHGGEEVAQRIAREQGFNYEGPAKVFDDHYVLTRPDHPEVSKRDSVHLTNKLTDLDEVKWAEQQPLVQRSKRGIIPKESVPRAMDFFSFLNSLQSQGAQPVYYTTNYGSGSSYKPSGSSYTPSGSSYKPSGYSSYKPIGSSKPSGSSSSKPSGSSKPSASYSYYTYTPTSGSSSSKPSGSYYTTSSGNSGSSGSGGFDFSSLFADIGSDNEANKQANTGKLGSFSTLPAPKANLDTYSGATKGVGLVSNKQSAYESMFNDPLWKKEWAFHDYRTKDVPVMDHNVVPVWKSGITGKNVKVCVVDDGVEHGHPDLEGNFQADWSYNAIADTPGSNPDPATGGRGHAHGTKCAGEIAMVANNGKCGVGVAYECKLAGVKLLGRGGTNLAEARALSHKLDTFDIYSNSWGPNDDGATMEAIGTLGAKAIVKGITEGRQGKGAIYTFAGGNGRHSKDNCGADGYVNSPYVIGITSVSQHGKTVYYSERCTAIFAGTYSGGNQYDELVSTIDLNGGCASDFSGTSAATPVATGIIALALQANPKLTYRDVYHLIAMTSEVAPVADNDNIWYKNGRGFWVSNDFGFGLMNAYNMVELAKTWKNVPAKSVCTVNVPLNAVKQFSVNKPAKITFSTDACKGSKDAINFLEQIEVASTVSYPYRGAISINLKSPSGTKSALLETREKDNSRQGLKAWKIKSVHNWGEDPKGTWEIEVNANALSGVSSSSGTAKAFTFTFHGTADKPAHYNKSPVRGYSAFRLPDGTTN